MRAASANNPSMMVDNDGKIIDIFFSVYHVFLKQLEARQILHLENLRKQLIILFSFF